MNEATIYRELFAAICHNESETVRKLLVEGADVNKPFPNSFRLTPLMVAARAGAHAVIPVLLEYGASVHTRCVWGRTAFHWLCLHGLGSHYHVESHTESARALLKAGADAYQPDDSGETPLILALSRRLRNVIRLINAYSPIPNGSGNRLIIPWLDVGYLRRTNSYLARYTDEEILADLRPPEPPEPGTTRRRRFARPYDAAWAQQADPHATDKRGYTALHHAAAMGLYEEARILIDRGAEVDAVARSGATPLMQAARCGHWKVGQLLLAHGADAYRRDTRGLHAVDYARRAGNRRMFPGE